MTVEVDLNNDTTIITGILGAMFHAATHKTKHVVFVKWDNIIPDNKNEATYPSSKLATVSVAFFIGGVIPSQ